MDEQQCASCGRHFARNSKPQWAFTLDGRPVGRIHTSCEPARYRREGSDSREVAWFRVWLWYVADMPKDRETNQWRASILAGRSDDTLSETLNDGQEALIRHWIDNGLKLDPATVPGIRAAYADLVREFKAWQARPELAPNGCS